MKVTSLIKTRHFEQRTNQRAIRSKQVEMALELGKKKLMGRWFLGGNKLIRSWVFWRKQKDPASNQKERWNRCGRSRWDFNHDLSNELIMKTKLKEIASISAGYQYTRDYKKLIPDPSISLSSLKVVSSDMEKEGQNIIDEEEKEVDFKAPIPTLVMQMKDLKLGVSVEWDSLLRTTMEFKKKKPSWQIESNHHNQSIILEPTTSMMPLPSYCPSIL